MQKPPVFGDPPVEFSQTIVRSSCDRHRYRTIAADYKYRYTSVGIGVPFRVHRFCRLRTHSDTASSEGHMTQGSYTKFEGSILVKMTLVYAMIRHACVYEPTTENG